MQIFSYSESNLAIALSNAYTSPEIIRGKNHFLYLTDYLSNSDIDAKSYVVEDNYVSRDFLHDYASYYALCFEPYPKFCKRIHFFCSSFTEEELKQSISGSAQPRFWDYYLGFVVVKPIPVTVIGYTILKTYNGSPTNSLRSFWESVTIPSTFTEQRSD